MSSSFFPKVRTIGTRVDWLRGSPFGVTSLALTAADQVVILLAIMFAPEEPVYERYLEPHWTDDVGCYGSSSRWLGVPAH